MEIRQLPCDGLATEDSWIRAVSRSRRAETAFPDLIMDKSRILDAIGKLIAVGNYCLNAYRVLQFCLEFAALRAMLLSDVDILPDVKRWDCH